MSLFSCTCITCDDLSFLPFVTPPAVKSNECSIDRWTLDERISFIAFCCISSSIIWAAGFVAVAIDALIDYSFVVILGGCVASMALAAGLGVITYYALKYFETRRAEKALDNIAVEAYKNYNRHPMPQAIGWIRNNPSAADLFTSRGADLNRRNANHEHLLDHVDQINPQVYKKLLQGPNKLTKDQYFHNVKFIEAVKHDECSYLESLLLQGHISPSDLTLEDKIFLLTIPKGVKHLKLLQDNGFLPMDKLSLKLAVKNGTPEGVAALIREKNLNPNDFPQDEKIDLWTDLPSVEMGAVLKANGFMPGKQG